MKKGFTLIELISVIVLIGVIALIATPITINVIDKSKQKAYEVVVSNIEQSAYNYSVYNELGYNRLYKSIQLYELQDNGYLDNKNVIDPRNNAQMTGCVFYRWLTDSNKYEFKYKEDCIIEQLYPDVVINVTNDNNKEWMKEYLRFEIVGEYDNYKYCIGKENCEKNIEYIGPLTSQEVGKDIYICATGYMGEEIGKSVCTKSYNVDPTIPNINVNSISTTSSKIVVNASCTDEISGVKDIKYGINDLEYQDSNVFSNLSTGTYKIKIKCTDNALNEKIVEETAKTQDIPKPTFEKILQVPDGTVYAKSRTIRIRYNNANIESPKYYYSLDGKTWKEVTTATYDVTFTSNGYLYAKTTDSKGNTSGTSTYTVTNIDTTEPSTSIAVSTKTTKAVLSATCSDVESGISKYEYSKDNGNTWISTGTVSNYTFTNLSPGATYTFKVRCTNGVGLSKEDNTTKTLPVDIPKPVIEQISPTSGGTWAQSRTIRITYSGTNVVNPEYYLKSTVSADIVLADTSSSNPIIGSCGTGTNPGRCSSSSVTTLVANTWYKVNKTTVDLLYKKNGYLYAQTKDSYGNKADAATYAIENIDTTSPNITLGTPSSTYYDITIPYTLSDPESGIKSYSCYIGGKLGTATSTSCSVSGLNPGTNYNYSVYAYNNVGLSSTISGTKSTLVPEPIKYEYKDLTYPNWTDGPFRYTINLSGYTKIAWKAHMRRQDSNSCDDEYNGEAASLFVDVKDLSGNLKKHFVLENSETGNWNPCCDYCEEYFDNSMDISSYNFVGNHIIEITIEGHIYDGYIQFQ